MANMTPLKMAIFLVDSMIEFDSTRGRVDFIEDVSILIGDWVNEEGDGEVMFTTLNGENKTERLVQELCEKEFLFEADVTKEETVEYMTEFIESYIDTNYDGTLSLVTQKGRSARRDD